MDLRVLRLPKRQIYLLFYSPVPGDAALNHLVAFFNGPFCHVEIAFPEKYGDEPWERVIWGTSIYQDEPVFFRQKTYQREGYVSIALEVTAAQLHQIRTHCQEHAARETPFSRMAMFMAYLPFQVIHTDATFCSKYVSSALQAGGLLTHVNPALMTPSSLFRAVQPNAIQQVVPSRMHVLTAHWLKKPQEPR